MKVFEYNLKLRSNDLNISRNFVARGDFSFHNLSKVIMTCLNWTGTKTITYFIEKESIEIVDSRISITKTMGINFKSDRDSICEDLLDRGSKFVMIYGDDTPFVFDIEVTDVIYDYKKDAELLNSTGKEPIESCEGEKEYLKILNILNDKNSADYEEIVEWIGENYLENIIPISEINENFENLELLFDEEDELDDSSNSSDFSFDIFSDLM
ncbi:IS1096 element passenger TnpR family protein [Peptoniphilus sp.]|uniref:IS1096 element passenger TnpR family protein n=1 Tax=Peptoniphilus sp. TaxID=1971214 RepID=UPI003991ACC0